MKPQDDDLRPLLQEWRDLPSCDNNLHYKVLARCAVEEPQPAWWTQITTLFAAFGLGLHPLRVAVWCVLGGLLIGASIGEFQSSRQREELQAEMPTRYLTQIDPTRTYAALDSR